MNITSVKDNVDLIEHDGREIYLIGTAHISLKSAELAEETIREIRPDTVCVELDEERKASLLDPDRWKNTDLFKIIKEGKSYLLMAQLALAGFQKKLGNKLEVKPGEEMVRSIKAGAECGAEIICADRNVRITLKRAWASASLWTFFKIFFSFLGSLFSNEEMSEDEIEKLKESDALQAMVDEFSDFLPGVKKSLLDERDLYLAQHIRNAPGKKIVAVVGAAHAPGIKAHFEDSIDIEELDQIPPPKKSLKFISWGLPILILGMITYGFMTAGAETSGEMIKIWILVNGVLAALGTLIALGHPLTVITAFIAAPITSLNPTIAAGWVCGLVECFLRKPRVQDLETIGDDVSSLKGLWRNRVSKVLLVVVFANLGSSLGTFIGIGNIAALL